MLMTTISSTLHHKVLPPRKRSAGEAPALILLHGLGADEDDLLELAQYLDERLLIVSARAPHPAPFGSGYSWYAMEDLGKPDPATFAQSAAKVRQFIEDVARGYGVDRSRVFLGGFSMGAIMSHAIVLAEPDSVHGVIAMSGYIAEQAGIPYAWQRVKGKLFFVSHGTFDPVIPVSYGRRAKVLLEKAQANLTYREYDMGHQIGEECLNDTMHWLSAHLGPL
jgi:phospholipase/carboxylesterase